MKKSYTLSLAFLILISQQLSSQSLSLVKDLNTKPLSLSFINSTGTQWQPSNTLIYFDGTDNKGQTLWRTDGTGEGTYSLSSPAIFSNYRIPFGDHSLLFDGADLFEGYELWISDGTQAGTHLLKDIFKGRESSYPGNFISVSGTVFFKAYTPVYGEELYKTDGTKQGTVLVKDLEPGPNSSYPIYKFDSPGVNAGALNGKLIFSASTSQTGRELFISDGTATSTVLLKDLYGSMESDPHAFVNLDGALYFLANKLDSVFLWKTDGTSAGSVQVSYLPATNLVVNNGKIYCSATDNSHGSELWISDGTSAGTHLLVDINPGPAR
ncbi:MAG TPA: hypothetical protein VHQ04_02380, partial [Puia sp.]|nr:hypothetical protein [Puia sp.]